MFDTENFDKEIKPSKVDMIDRFFEGLKLGDKAYSDEANKSKDKLDIAVPDVMIGELMSMVDTDDRFVYLGSETTPPCERHVYWNIVKTVYPIKLEHLK